MTGRAGRCARSHLTALAAFASSPSFSVLPVLPVLSAQTIRAEGQCHHGRLNRRWPAPASCCTGSVSRRRARSTPPGPTGGAASGSPFGPTPRPSICSAPAYRHRVFLAAGAHQSGAAGYRHSHHRTYDTSSTAPVALEARHLVVTRPGRGRLPKRAGSHRAAKRGDTKPGWRRTVCGRPGAGPLPRGTIGLELGESDVSPDAVTRRGDSLIVALRWLRVRSRSPCST